MSLKTRHFLFLVTCPDGYEKYLEVCYKAFKALKTFSKSAKTCRADGGTLAMPRDAGIHDFLFSLMKPLLPLPLFDFWIGLHDERQEGKWEWIDGTALGTGYNRWKNGQPDNYGGNQDCAFYSYWGSGRSPSSAFCCSRQVTGRPCMGSGPGYSRETWVPTSGCEDDLEVT
ncbi:PREDICTED: perlucin-like protein [Branchiostoma belcheri]|uniref:Perlucin-like protein n=1 Tax=Branchiostoma belcheri TaxID=7741 RepID=A0A6P4XPI2_BRABE|nr:PREDICTED: perlucin-like protein [Branchiostoma belcheri]